jgi:hypothetical protein
MILSLAINENCQACFCWPTARRTWGPHPSCQFADNCTRNHLAQPNSALICSSMFIFVRAKYCLYLWRPHITSITGVPKSP